MRIADCGFRNNSSAIRNPKSEITGIELRTPNSELRTVRGLTLVELLVAMAILVIVSGSTLLIFRGITRAWRTGELRSERYQQARLLFELFEREIASSVANVRYPMVGINSSDKATMQEGSSADQIFFVCTLPGRVGLVERGYWVNVDGELMCHDEEPADGNYTTGIS